MLVTLFYGCIDYGPVHRPFTHFAVKQVRSVCEGAPCREQHATRQRLSKNESLPNCVLVPVWRATVGPRQNAAKPNGNWKLQGKKTHQK